MAVSLDWLAQINVTINTSVVQAPTFNNCMIMGVFPTASRPNGAGGFATNWGTNPYYAYSSLTQLTTDFRKLEAAAVAASNFTQAFKYQILIKAATQFFQQTPAPVLLYVSCIDNTTTVDYTVQFNKIIAATNDFYACYIADQVTATQLNTGINPAIASLITDQNYKLFFVDTADLAITSGHFLYDATNDGIGSQRAMLFAHTLNPQTAVPTVHLDDPSVTLGAACMGAFFTNLFSSGIGLKALAGQTLQNVPSDSAITRSSLGEINGNGRTGLMSVNANVYPSFGTGGQGYMQYGFMASATNSNLRYLDQIIGADYIKLNVQADLASYILSKQPTGGVPFSDVGIQALANTFKKTLQTAVTQNIIQQFSNSDVGVVPYSQVLPADKTNRIYQGLSASLVYLGRIQRVAVSITLGL